MEKLINDDNRSIATFAITTLLKVRTVPSTARPLSLARSSGRILTRPPPARRLATRRRSTAS